MLATVPFVVIWMTLTPPRLSASMASPSSAAWSDARAGLPAGAHPLTEADEKGRRPVSAVRRLAMTRGLRVTVRTWAGQPLEGMRLFVAGPAFDPWTGEPCLLSFTPLDVAPTDSAGVTHVAHEADELWCVGPGFWGCVDVPGDADSVTISAAAAPVPTVNVRSPSGGPAADRAVVAFVRYACGTLHPLDRTTTNDRGLARFEDLHARVALARRRLGPLHHTVVAVESLGALQTQGAFGEWCLETARVPRMELIDPATCEVCVRPPDVPAPWLTKAEVYASDHWMRIRARPLEGSTWSVSACAGTPGHC